MEEEEKWRFKEDMLREECSLLRREKESAVEELQRNRATLRSALLFLGKKKINEEHKDNGVLEAEIEDLNELPRANVTSANSNTKKINSFDKKAFILRQRLEKVRLSKQKHVADSKESFKSMLKIEEESSISAQNNSNNYFDLEVLRRKMEGISKGVYERMEKEYGAMLVSNTHTPHVSASSSKRFEFPDDSSLTSRPPLQESGARKCSGQCKTIVRRIMEQVREESKQWSEMQEMLGQVKKEMDQLKSSHDFWHNQALDSKNQIQALHSTVQEWKGKAFAYKTKVKELKREVSAFRAEMDNYREIQNGEKRSIRIDPEVISLGAHIAKEKRAMVCRLKEKENYCPINNEIESEILKIDDRRKSQVFEHGSKRFAFQNIGNVASPKAKQNGKAVFHSYENC